MASCRPSRPSRIARALPVLLVFAAACARAQGEPAWPRPAESSAATGTPARTEWILASGGDATGPLAARLASVGQGTTRTEWVLASGGDGIGRLAACVAATPQGGMVAGSRPAPGEAVAPTTGATGSAGAERRPVASAGVASPFITQGGGVYALHHGSFRYGNTTSSPTAACTPVVRTVTCSAPVVSACPISTRPVFVSGFGTTTTVSIGSSTGTTRVILRR